MDLTQPIELNSSQTHSASEPQQYRVLAVQYERTLGKHPLAVETATVASLRDAADEIDRLRDAIENASHTTKCQNQQRWHGDRCTCWKADAL